MGEPEKFTDLSVVMKAVSDRPGILNQHFLASCTVFGYPLAGQPEAHWVVVLT